MRKSTVKSFLFTQTANELFKEIQNRNYNPHLSGNIYKTTTFVKMANEAYINIPAQRYDLKKYSENKTIVYTGQGSYAKAIDISGGFSGEHKNYIDDSIRYALDNMFNRMRSLGLTPKSLTITSSLEEEPKSLGMGGRYIEHK